MIEEWKEIKGFPGYEVSNHGRVRSFKKTGFLRMLKPYDTGKGYMQVCLYRNGAATQRAIHHLVWNAFGDRPRTNKLEIDHKDENKLNNRIDNLQLLTSRENVAKYHQTKRDLPTGVCLTGIKRYVAHIYRKNYGQCNLGTYDTPEEASQSYQKALEEITCP